MQIELQWIKNAVHDKQIFLVVDESTLSGIPYLNILVGSLETSFVSYLDDYQLQPYALHSSNIAQAVDDAVRSLGMNRNSFCLLLSSSAKYMLVVGAIPECLYPELLHVTCIAHLLLNCPRKVKSYMKTLIS